MFSIANRRIQTSDLELAQANTLKCFFFYMRMKYNFTKYIIIGQQVGIQ